MKKLKRVAVAAFGLLLFGAVPIKAQEKKKIMPEDYSRWGKLRQEALSHDGRWASYVMAYDSGRDTLFVAKIGTAIRHAFPKGNSGEFAGKRWYACNTVPSGMALLDLDTGKVTNFPKAVSWKFASTEALVIASGSPDSTALEIIRLPDLERSLLSTAAAFSVSPDGKHIAFALPDGAESKAMLFNIKTEKASVMATGEKDAFSAWAWDSGGKALAFLQKENGAHAKVNCYRIAEAKRYVFEAKNLPPQPETELAPWGAMRLAMAKDGAKVFFGVRQKQVPKKAEIVQRWNGSDNWIYTMWRGAEKGWNAVPKLAAWWPETGRFEQVTSDTLPVVVLDGAQRFAIAHDPAAKKWEDTETGKPDLYIAEIGKHGFEHLLSGHSADQNRTSMAPSRSRMAYFRKGVWWVQDFEAGWERCVSAQIPHPMAGEGTHGNTEAFGVAGWTKEGKSILLYDEYDVWRADFSGTPPERLTRGREHKIRFRIAHVAEEAAPVQNFFGLYGRNIDLKKGIVLAALDTETFDAGWWIWKQQGATKKLAYGPSHYSQLLKAGGAETYTYIQENFDRPPALMAVRPGNKPELIFQSNPHYGGYLSGRSELIKYQDSRGNRLSGALCYPAGYDPSKTYPMVVHIYEKKAKELHRHVSPSSYNGDGVNIANLVAQGYFVLLPDIVYEIGNPGRAATDCVLAAVDRALQVASVDPKRMGLEGHSFGGYEANFIITQTDRFAAAVAGAGASDLQSWYLTVGWDSGTPEAWRFEDQQWRMGKSLFEDPEGYARNSPVVHAKNVTTPLLGWTGAEDRQVHWYQPIEYYLALKKLDKKQVLLVYPEEGHEILAKDAQADLTCRMESWFAHFLKDAPPEPWIAEGTK